MLIVSKLLRPEVRNFQIYLPGKPIEEVQRKLGLKRVVKLASNENALGTSRKVIRALSKNNQTLFRYPESSGILLRRAIAQSHRLNASEVILGAGSDELIELLGKTFFNRGDEVIVSEHAFMRYKMAGDLMGAKTIVVPMKNFTHDLSAMSKKINRRTKAVFIANPNNPTGTYVAEKAVRNFFSHPALARPRGSPFIVFDEAYYEYSSYLAPDYPESLRYFRSGLNLVILRTFSKIYGLAGLRVGYGIARKEVVNALDRVRPPFNVSSVAQRAALIALADVSHVRKSLQCVREGLAYLSRQLGALNLKFLPSAGNFLLIDFSPRAGSQIFEKLLKKGVIVRTMEEYDFPHHLRVTVGSPEENQFFIRKLKEVLSSQ